MLPPENHENQNFILKKIDANQAANIPVFFCLVKYTKHQYRFTIFGR